MKKLFLVLFIISAGCSVVKDTKKQLTKLNKKNPTTVASFCQVSYPCVTKKIDTLFRDSFIYKDRIDTVFYKDVVLNDNTQQHPQKLVLKYRDKVAIKTNEIIRYIDDSSKIKLCQEDKKNLNDKIDELQKKNNNLVLLISLLGIILIGLAYMLSKKKNENTSRK